jgi:hypothetical protein
MKPIIVKVPDNLTPLQEALAVSKKLTQKALSGSGSAIKNRIGDEINIIEPEQQIIIQRVNKEKPIEFCKCSVCHTEYQSNLAAYYFTNYGGSVRKMPVCSPECVSIMVSAFPGRIADNKKKLIPVRFF